jgi:methyl-accepting chemotaxis protein
MKKIKLSMKLIGGFGMVSLITLMVGFLGWNGVSDSAATLKKISTAQGVAKEMLQRQIDHLNWARKVDQFQLNETAAEIAVEKDEHKCGFGKWYYGENRQLAEQEIPEIKPLLAQIEDPHRRLHRSAQELENILKKGPEFRKEALAYYQSETIEILKKIQVIFNEMGPKVNQHITTINQKAEALGSRIKWLALSGMALGTILALAFGLFLSRSITKPIQQVVEGLTKGSDQVASASAQLSTSSQSLAEGTSEQAAALEETSSSMEEMASMTRQNADNANQAKSLMDQTTKVIEEANQAMKELTHSMQAISGSSEETGKIIKTIDEIAFQTNLLALNAAVEAARAGEAGAGFAVVADEVRNLAMRAAEAAKNTSSLIEETVDKIKTGSDIVGKTNQAFEKVSGGSQKIAELVNEIAAATGEQSQGIEQINKAISQMDQVIQRNAANAEESAAASEEMNAQAEQMKEFVGDLAGLIGGKQNGVQGPSPTYSRSPGQTGKVLGNPTKALPHRPLAQVIGKERGRKKLPGKTTEKRPEDLIPFDDGDFKDF